MRKMFWIAVLLSMAGCAAAGDDTASTATRSPAPQLGAADSMDSADYNCQITARQATRHADSPSWAERCDDDGNCSWLWRVTADVADSALASGFEPAVLYRGNDGEWYSVSGKATQGAEQGFSRYGFDVWEKTISPAHTSSTSIAHFELPLIPYLQHPDGRRVFDHNRVTGAEAPYLLTHDNAFSLLDDPRVCSSDPVDAVLQFGADGQITVLGELRGGHRVALVYDENRLPQCRTTHNGNPAWSLEGFVAAAGEVQSTTMIHFPETYGIDADPVAATFELPTTADEIEVWFRNTAYAGGFCEAYDSDSGRNYRFGVTPLAAADWMGNSTVTISRGAPAPCEDGQPIADGFDYDTWARQRATNASICTEVYAAGITDREGTGDVFDVAVEVRAVGASEWQTYPMELDGRVGNNMRYFASLRAMDPFPMYGDHCPTVPYQTDASSMWVDVEVRFVVNGQIIDGVQNGRFAQYLFDECR